MSGDEDIARAPLVMVASSTGYVDRARSGKVAVVAGLTLTPVGGGLQITRDDDDSTVSVSPGKTILIKGSFVEVFLAMPENPWRRCPVYSVVVTQCESRSVPQEETMAVLITDEEDPRVIADRWAALRLQADCSVADEETLARLYQAMLKPRWASPFSDPR